MTALIAGIGLGTGMAFLAFAVTIAASYNANERRDQTDSITAGLAGVLAVCGFTSAAVSGAVNLTIASVAVPVGVLTGAALIGVYEVTHYRPQERRRQARARARARARQRAQQTPQRPITR